MNKVSTVHWPDTSGTSSRSILSQKENHVDHICVYVCFWGRDAGGLLPVKFILQEEQMPLQAPQNKKLQWDFPLTLPISHLQAPPSPPLPSHFPVVCVSFLLVFWCLSTPSVSSVPQFILSPVIDRPAHWTGQTSWENDQLQT